MPWVYTAIMIITIMFALNVTYETYDDMSTKFSVTDSESKNCLVDFQKSNCNILKLTDECEKLLQCTQKDRKEEMSIKAFSLFDFIVEEIQENAAIPVILTIIMLIYQITKNVEGLRKDE